MSENLDLVRSIYADWERSDFNNAEWAHPDIEWVFADGPTPERSTGLAGTAAAFRQWAALWDDFRIHADEFIELDADSVLALVHFSGRGKMSGIDVGQLPSKTAAVFYLRGGKVARYVVYWDRDRAFADLGLEEQATAEESTTPDPEELLRRLIEAFNRRDLDAVLGYLAPDVVYDTSHSGFGIYTGVPAVRGFFEDWVSSYEEFEVAAQEMVDLGNGVGYAILRQRGRPVGSSGEVRRRFASVGLSVNGLWVRFTTYTDIDEARAAAERLAEERR